MNQGSSQEWQAHGENNQAICKEKELRYDTSHERETMAQRPAVSRMSQLKAITTKCDFKVPSNEAFQRVALKARGIPCQPVKMHSIEYRVNASTAEHIIQRQCFCAAFQKLLVGTHLSHFLTRIEEI